MRSPVATAFAIAFGLVVLIGYFAPVTAGVPVLRDLRILIVDWAAILASFVTLVAILGLVGTHWNKLRANRNPDRYSIFMLAGFVAAVVVGVIAYGFGKFVTVTDFQQFVTAVQVPVETSLMALLAVTLTLAGIRLLRRRLGLLPITFFLSVLLFLLLNSGLLASQLGIPFIDPFLAALRLLPVAGGRGILLGIALGSLMAGLRIIFGADRPYSG
jgi:hypothetical protein